jgi:hypothetical protein
VILVLASVLAACGTPAPVEESRSEATIAFLRSVRAPETGAQDAFVDELARLGYRLGENLELLAADPAEVHTDPADVEQTIEGWLVSGVDVIVALSITGAMAAEAAAQETDALLLANSPSTLRALPALQVANTGGDALALIANTTAVGGALLVLEPTASACSASSGRRRPDCSTVCRWPTSRWRTGHFRLVLNQRVAEELGVLLHAVVGHHEHPPVVGTTHEPAIDAELAALIGIEEALLAGDHVAPLPGLLVDQGGEGGGEFVAC